MVTMLSVVVMLLSVVMIGWYYVSVLGGDF